MLTLDGYQIGKLLHRGRFTRIYQADRKRDGLAVILKCLEKPTSIKVAKLIREYELGRFLCSEHILYYHGLEESENGPVIVMEDLNGRPLTRLIDNGHLVLTQFLDIAIKLASIMGEVHKKNVIHKDIKPDNFLMNQENGVIKVIDFGIACLLPSERATLKVPEILEGTIGYMSPEQRGITHLAIDYRTDFYSLGATLLHLLTGSPPNRNSDSLDTLNTSFDLDPVPEKKVLTSAMRSDIPKMLLHIIRKCMAENPDDRYRTAYGIQADLERVFSEWKEKEVIRSFKLGQQDLSQRLQVPQKLYGREYETSRIMAAFKRIRSREGCYMVLVSGEAGIGKSSAIHEVQKSVVMGQGYFVSAKCGPFKMESPYDPFISVGKALINQVLSEPEFKIAQWKKELLRALGSNGKLLSDLIPEVKGLMGSLPEPSAVTPEDSQLRFQRIYRKFLGVFARKKHPLIIFLDDLHWADDASLALMEYLLTYGGNQSLLLLGTYRYDGGKGVHMLTSLVNRLGTYGDLFETLSISPLGPDHTAQLISETLGCSQKRAAPLARLVQEKTDGNPFYLIQLLKYLHQKGLLYCNLKAGAWNWSVRKIRVAGLPLSIIELLTESILALPSATLDLIKQAACIGHRFDLKTLMMVSGRQGRDIADQLMPAMKQGWIQPDDEAYKYLVGIRQDERRAPERLITYSFMHGYVQRAAYVLLKSKEARYFHYAVGRHFFSSIDRTRTDSYVMEIVEHLHKAEITDSKEGLMLAEWYLCAGIRAGSTAGFTLALGYFQMGWQYLAENAWDDHYELALRLRLGAAEMAFFDGQYELMNILCESVEGHVRHTLDLIKIFQLRAQYFAAQQRFKETLTTVENALSLLSTAIPRVKSRATVRTEFFKILEEAGGVDGLANLPIMGDPEVLAIMQLLVCAIPSAYFSAPRLFPAITLEMARLSVQYGNAPESCYAYGCQALLMNDTELSFQLGSLSIALLEKYDVRRIRPQIYYHYCCFLQHRREHLNKVLLLLRKGIISGFEVREYEYAARSEVEYADILLFKGTNLKTVVKRIKRFMAMTSQVGQEHSLFILNNLRYIAEELARPMNEYGARHELHYDRVLPKLQAQEFHEGIFYSGLAGLVLHYFRGEYDQALEAMAIAEPWLQTVAGKMILAEYHFYVALSLIAKCGRSGDNSEYLQRLDLHQAYLEELAESAPINRLHQFQLILAERARVLGHHWEALEFYDRAVNHAHRHGFLLTDALACELAGNFLNNQGLRKCAQPYLRQAWFAYRELSLRIRLNPLEIKYEMLFGALPAEDSPDPTPTHHEYSGLWSSSELGTLPGLYLFGHLEGAQ